VKILTFRTGPLEVNTYVVIPGDGRKALVIDPGGVSVKLMEVLKGLEVHFIVNTHGHFDHIGGNNTVQQVSGAKIAIHFNDAPMLTDPDLNLSRFSGETLVSSPADLMLGGNSLELECGGGKLKILEVPGHTRGHIALYCETEGILFGGDLMFRNSIGRTDFPGGSLQAIQASIEKVLLLPGDTRIYPGHDEDFRLSDFRKVYRYFFEGGEF
jgi:glyoxylase-like metal-dependent hydrolase (beta-lactamase superfamily II)